MELKHKQVLQKQLLLVAITSISIYIGFKYFLPIFFPFLIAYLITRLILPIVRFLKQKLHVPVGLGSVIAIILTATTLGGLFFYIGSILIKQLQGLLRNIPIYSQIITTNMCKICCYVDSALGLEDGCANQYLSDNMESLWGVVQEVGIPMLSQHTVNFFFACIGLLTIIFIILIAVINMVIDYDSISKSYKSSELYRAISPVTSKLGSVGIAYAKTQLIIMTINSIILVTGFYFTGSSYAVLAGIGISVMDAFPVIGSGLFLVPIAIFKLLHGNYVHAAVIITLFGACELIRSIIEPRLLGDKIGLKPIFTLIAMYVGVDLFGVVGFLLGPLALVIIKAILQEAQCFKSKEEEG